MACSHHGLVHSGFGVAVRLRVGVCFDIKSYGESRVNKESSLKVAERSSLGFWVWEGTRSGVVDLGFGVFQVLRRRLLEG